MKYIVLTALLLLSGVRLANADTPSQTETKSSPPFIYERTKHDKAYVRELPRKPDPKDNDPHAIEEIGLNGELPKTYFLEAMETSNKPISKLRIEKNGNVVFQLEPAVGKFAGLDTNTAVKLFGKPTKPENSEGITEPNYVSFALKGCDSQGKLSVFALDLEAGKGEGFKNYRVRGTEISKPEWQAIQ